jgi:hypothetical protein
MTGIIQEAINSALKEIEFKKIEFIKKKIQEKGYIYPTEPARFPIISLVNENGWTYVFANNGTKQGDFIVAVSDIESKSQQFEDDNSHKIVLSFRWQEDNFEPVKL